MVAYHEWQVDELGTLFAVEDGLVVTATRFVGNKLDAECFPPLHFVLQMNIDWTIV
jgi:hypothetical protein